MRGPGTTNASIVRPRARAPSRTALTSVWRCHRPSVIRRRALGVRRRLAHLADVDDHVRRQADDRLHRDPRILAAVADASTFAPPAIVDEVVQVRAAARRRRCRVSVPVRRPTMISTFVGARPATAALTRSSRAFDVRDQAIGAIGARRPRRRSVESSRTRSASAAAIDDDGPDAERRQLRRGRVADRRGRTRDPAAAARSARHPASETCRPSAASRPPADTGSTSRRRRRDRRARARTASR